HRRPGERGTLDRPVTVTVFKIGEHDIRRGDDETGQCTEKKAAEKEVFHEVGKRKGNENRTARPVMATGKAARRFRRIPRCARLRTTRPSTRLLRSFSNGHSRHRRGTPASRSRRA